MTKNKIFIFAFLALVVTTLMIAGILADEWTESSEPDISSFTVYVDNEAIWTGECNLEDTVPPSWTCTTNVVAIPGIERGETTEIRAYFTANNDFSEIKVKAWITGYRDDIEDESSRFDVFAGNSYSKTLRLDIPSDIDANDDYTLHVEIQGKTDMTGVDEAQVDLLVQRASNYLEILSVDVYSSNSYSNEFSAGETIYVDVVVKNRGNQEAEDVYVEALISSLGITRVKYLGDLEPVDDEDDEDAKHITISLYIPENTAEGSYILDIEAYTRDSSDEVTKTILIVEGTGTTTQPSEEGQIEVTVQTSYNEFEAGTGAVYSLLVTNFDSESSNFIIETEDLEGWATSQINPQAFSLMPGQSKLVNIYLAANEDAVEGDHVFTVNVNYGSESKSYTLTANVTEAGTGASLKTVLFIVGLILAVVIIVLLVLLLSKGRSKATMDEEAYY